MPSLDKAGPVVMERKILIIYVINLLLLFHYSYLPLECGPSFENKKLELPFTHLCFVPNLVKIGQVVLDRQMNEQIYGRLTTGNQGSWLELKKPVKATLLHLKKTGIFDLTYHFFDPIYSHLKYLLSFFQVQSPVFGSNSKSI